MPILLNSTTPKESRDDWNTPPWLLDLIREFKPIGFDPAPNETSFVNPIDAAIGCDGLEVSWEDRGLCFVNPPYSHGLYKKFCQKAANEAQKGAEIIMLTPANVETKAWQQYLWNADAWCFPAKRINFYFDGKEKRGVNFASALVYFGPNVEEFAKVFTKLGTVVG